MVTARDIIRRCKEIGYAMRHYPTLIIIPVIRKTQVEVCAGEGNLSRGLQQCGLRTKAFDVTWDTIGNICSRHQPVPG